MNFDINNNNYWPAELRQGNVLPVQGNDADAVLAQPKVESRFLWKKTENAARVNEAAQIHFGRVKQAYRLTSYGLIEKIKNLFGQMRPDAKEEALKARIDGYITQINLANTELNRLDRSIIWRNQQAVGINGDDQRDIARIDADIPEVSRHVEELIKSLKGTRFEKLYKEDLGNLQNSRKTLERNYAKTSYMSQNEDAQFLSSQRVDVLQGKIDEIKEFKLFRRFKPLDKCLELTRAMEELNKIIGFQQARNLNTDVSRQTQAAARAWIKGEFEAKPALKAQYKQSMLEQVASIEGGLFGPEMHPTPQELEDAKRKLQVIEQTITDLDLHVDEPLLAAVKVAIKGIDLALRGVSPNRDVTAFTGGTLVSNREVVGRVCDILVAEKPPLGERLGTFDQLIVKQAANQIATIYSNDELVLDDDEGIGLFQEGRVDDYIRRIKVATYHADGDITGLLDCVDLALMTEPFENLRSLVGFDSVTIFQAQDPKDVELEWLDAQKATLYFTCLADVSRMNEQGEEELIGYIAVKRTVVIPHSQAEAPVLDVQALKANLRTTVEDRYGAFTPVVADEADWITKNRAIETLPA